MSTAVAERPARAGTGNGGVPARRAVVRWAWRLLRREWRQQLLILALIVVAVAATVVGSAVATNTPPSATALFGTARDRVTLQGGGPQENATIAALRQRYGRVDVIENQTIAIPGSVDTYDLRAQDPHGPFGQPMLSLVSGHFPAGPGQVAVTSGVASAFGLSIGSRWQAGGSARQVTGIVVNPQRLLDEFALVTPGQVGTPTEVTVLFDAPARQPPGGGLNVQTPASVTAPNVINPETISIAGLTVGMLLIALVAAGGFTVLAQRRLRSLGMLASLGATGRHIRLVVLANGMVTGAAGAIGGTVLGLALWLAYRPRLETSAHHVIGAFSLPWPVLAVALVLAVAASTVAAARPARAVSRVPIVAALSGRPTPPKQTHRWAVPAGLACLVLAFLLLGASGASVSQGGGMGQLALGLVILIIGVILLAPLCLVALARIGRGAPVAVRLALRDMARYRSRSGSALAAISIGVLIAIVICIASVARYSNVLDYAGPNLASDQLVLYPGMPSSGPSGPGAGRQVHLAGPGGGPAAGPSAGQLRAMAAKARGIAAALGSSSTELDTAGASLRRAVSGRNWSGPVYVATPQLLRAFGIKPAQINPDADILTMRPGLDTLTRMQLILGKAGPPPGGGGNGGSWPCPGGACLASPKIEEVSALPSGTSAPNTVITEHAVRRLGLHPGVAGWLIQARAPLTAAQLSGARQAAAAGNLILESRSSVPTSAEITNWATGFGLVLALGILAMSGGLLRSETARDLRTLTATGAGGGTRRALTATTVGALALLGAVLGTAAGYLATIAWFRSNALDGLSSLGNVPVANLLIILVGMPLAAAGGGWLLGGREPPAIARRPLD